MGRRCRHILWGLAFTLLGANILTYPGLRRLPGEFADPNGARDRVRSRGVPFSYHVLRDTGPFRVWELRTPALSLDLGFCVLALLIARSVCRRLRIRGDP